MDNDEAMDDGPEKKMGIRRYLNAQIDTKWADLILLACFFCSGLIDSMAFNMYGCFVSMQTGTHPPSSLQPSHRHLTLHTQETRYSSA